MKNEKQTVGSKIYNRLFNNAKVKKFFSVSLLSNYSLNWTAQNYLRAYEISAYVYGAVRKRAEKVGEIEFRLTDSRTGKEIENNKILDLLAQPNEYQAKSEFFQLYQIYKDLTGEAYIYLVRLGDNPNSEVKEMHLLRPDLFIKHTFDDKGSITGYVFTKESGGGQITYDANDIIFSNYPNPFDKYRGLSPLKAGALAVDTENQLSTYHNKVLQNGGKIEGILSFKSELTDSQIEQAKAQFEKHFSGSEKSGKPLVMAGDATYQNLGLTPGELSYLESKKMTRDDILLIYGVPKAIVAQTDDVNYANAKEGKSIFLSETVRPLLQDLTEKLDQSLVVDGITLDFVDPTPEDVEQAIKKIDCGARNYYMTINEMRVLSGMDEIDGGDVFMVPFNLMAVNRLDETGIDSSPVTAGLKTKQEVDTYIKSVPHPLKNKDFRLKYHANYLATIAKQQKEVLKAVRRIVSGQKKRMVAKMTNMPKSVKGKKAMRKKGVVDDFFDLSIEMSLAKEQLLPFLEKIAVESGNAGFKLFNVGKPYVLSAQIKSTLDKRSELFARETTTTTYKQLQRAFKQSFDNSETNDQLVDRIENVFGDIGRGRAKVIADTETLVANQTGAYDSYKSAGVPIKIWVSVLDSSTRESHADIDGEERLLDVPFSNGLMHPGDPSGDAAETVNCRCTI